VSTVPRLHAAGAVRAAAALVLAAFVGTGGAAAGSAAGSRGGTHSRPEWRGHAAGKLIDLRLAERADLPTLAGWFNDLEFTGEFEPFEQTSLSELAHDFDVKPDERWYVVQARDTTPIGYVAHGKASGGCWIGYMLVPEARGKRYGSEAVQVIVDYLFLHKDFGRIQAETHPANVASQRVLEEAGFSREGLIRESFFSRGVWRDTAMYSLLREEWREPRVLPAGRR
jgi:RimJ/RimL family protein N-acetyltransferase